MRSREDSETRFKRLVRRDKVSGCWSWNSHRDHRGYGRFWYRGRSRPAHRWAYERAYERAFLRYGATDWPALTTELELDHLCGNRGCVNPAHLEPVPHEENMFRMAQRRRAKKLQDE